MRYCSRHSISSNKTPVGDLSTHRYMCNLAIQPLDGVCRMYNILYTSMGTMTTTTTMQQNHCISHTRLTMRCEMQSAAISVCVSRAIGHKSASACEREYHADRLRSWVYYAPSRTHSHSGGSCLRSRLCTHTHTHICTLARMHCATLARHRFYERVLALLENK